MMVTFELSNKRAPVFHMQKLSSASLYRVVVKEEREDALDEDCEMLHRVSVTLSQSVNEKRLPGVARWSDRKVISDTLTSEAVKWQFFATRRVIFRSGWSE